MEYQESINVACIGLGGRGFSILTTVDRIEKVKVVAVCDLYPDRAERGRTEVEEAQGHSPFTTTNYREILGRDDVDAVFVTTSWEPHIRICIEAMKAGKYVASEVGGAYSIQQCWELVRAYEETGVPCMLLENCCYNREELMALNMVKQGIFGEVVHCAGGYHHDLRGGVAKWRENHHYRLQDYKRRNCENYPTHELGPIAKILDINRGNRMLTLSATASKAVGMAAYLQETGSDLAGVPFAQGDIVTTVIRCARGETIVLTLDTTLPCSYSRGFTVRGTKGMLQEANRSIFLSGLHNQYESDGSPLWNNFDEYYDEYDHPLWKLYKKSGIWGGHGGMDGLVLQAFLDAARKKILPPIDVYDMAAWMSVAALSEESIALGGQPVPVPDFTDGKWIERTDEPPSLYTLDRILEAYEL